MPAPAASRVAHDRDAMARSRVFELTALATVHLALGERGNGVAVGNQALDLAERVRSVRRVDRLEPLEAEINLHRHYTVARELA